MKKGPKALRMNATAKVRAALVQKAKMKRRKKQMLVLPRLQAAQVKPVSVDLAKQIECFPLQDSHSVPPVPVFTLECNHTRTNIIIWSTYIEILNFDINMYKLCSL